MKGHSIAMRISACTAMRFILETGNFFPSPKLNQNQRHMTTKQIHHITLPSGLVFTSKRDFAETLFHPVNGKTADGYFTTHQSAKHGTRSLRFHHGNGELFALIVSNGRDASARTAWKQDGKVWNLYGLTDEGKRLLGFHGMEYAAEIDACIEIVNKAMERSVA